MKKRLTSKRVSGGLALFAFLVCASLAQAQLTTGTIVGTVTDQSGAAVPGAGITITNADTGAMRQSETNATGRYEAPNLPVGNYEVSVSLSGFQTSVRAGIELSVGRTALVDVTLQVGEVAQTVTVTGEVAFVETTTATVSNLVDAQKVEDLPINNRDLTQLAYLQPGVLKVPRTNGGVFSGMGDTLTVAGARGTQNLFLLDGVSNSDISGNPQGASGSYIGAETVKEFQIITNNYSAQYQSAAGAIVSAITKSGTNSLHGSAFWTLRNDNLDAAKWEDNAFGNEKPEFKRNQFGGSIGGPIIPDRTFFFGSFEGLRERQNATGLVTVFSPSVHQGFDQNGDFVGVDPVIVPYLALYPIPGVDFPADRDFGNGTTRIVGTEREPVNSDFVAAKFDHQLSSSNLLTGTFNWDQSDRSPFGVLEDWSQGSSNEKWTVSVGHTGIISPTTLNEFNFGISWSEIFGDVPIGTRDTSALRFHPDRDTVGQINPPDVSSVGYRVNYSSYLQKTLQFKDGLSFTRGNHSFRAGVEIKRFRYVQDSCSRGCNGIYDFRRISNFLKNEPRRLQIFIPGSESPVRNLKQILFGGYFQDNWQVSQSLTLNLGMRYEFATIPDEDDDQISSLVDFQHNQVSVPQAIAAKFPDYDPPFAGNIDGIFQTNPTMKSFSPRFGFAWAPGDRRTSLRGGFGIFYVHPVLYHLRTSLQELPPFTVTGRLDSGPAEDAGNPLRMYPTAVNDYIDLLRGRPNIRYLEYDWKNAYIYRWSLTLQREVSDWVLSAGYTGSRAAHLLVQGISNLNRWVGWPDNPTGPKQWANPDVVDVELINPEFGEIRTQSPQGNSFFQGLALGAQKRLSNGFQIQMAYNFSKTTDQGSGVTSGGDELLQNQRGIYQWDMHLKKGLSQYDIRNSFVTNFSYEFPGQDLAGAAGAILGGWQMNGIITLTDGSPLSVLDQNGIQEDYIDDNEYLRANLIPGGDNNAVLGNPSEGQARYYDTSQYVPSFCMGSRVCQEGDPDYLPGFFGTSGRNTVTGPGLATFDFSLLKNINLTEENRIQFRAEFFNLFNRPNFGTPRMAPYDSDGVPHSNAGVISSTRGSARQIQVGLKFIF